VNIALILFAIVATTALVFIAIALWILVNEKGQHGKAVLEVKKEMGEDFSLEPLDAGLYHPTFDGVTESITRRKLNKKERFDPTEDWGKESIFDLPATQAGVYKHGK
jgi:hypothetical protein